MKLNKKKSRASGTEQMIAADRAAILTKTSSFYTREAYKALRTNVNFSLADSEGCRVLLLTSGLQGEGKSITALNLAISLSEDGNRVILLDCDLRRPKLGRLLEISSINGLSDTIIHPEILDEVITHYRTNLDVMLAGHIPPNPSELLGSARMSKLIDTLKQKYDYIILDTPPVNVVTDAAVTSRWADGVLFVVRANQSERGAVTHAVEQLGYAKANLLGFILNGVDAEATGYSKYRYKRYGYGRYGYGKYGYGRYGYSRNGYGQGYGYGSGRGYGYGYGYGYGQGYGYGEPGVPSQEAYNAVADSAAEARNEKQ